MSFSADELLYGNLFSVCPEDGLLLASAYAEATIGDAALVPPNISHPGSTYVS